MNPVPIALFCFKRPGHVKKTVESLLKNQEASDTPLYVFCDGPRGEHDMAGVKATREYVESIEGFSSKTLSFSEQNRGLAKSIMSGVGQLLEQYDRLIVMEDDLEVSPYFLDYMRKGLERYQDQPEVASIHGYCFPLTTQVPPTFFMKGADCWGWGTWRRAWRDFETDGAKLLSELRARHLTDAFDMGGVVPNTQMLKDQIKGLNDSWAIRWHASCFLKEQLTLFPGKSLVNNIGNDASGAHCEKTHMFETTMSKTPIEVGAIPIQASEIGLKAVQSFYRAAKPSLYSRVWAKAHRVLGVKHG